MIKKPNILILMVVMISLIMTSCVEEYEIVDKDFESRLVINALFDSASPWSVEISNTADNFNPDTDNEKITFAKVEIFDQNDKYLYELFHQGDGIYENGEAGPSPKREYSIKVTATGYHAVTAKGYVPEKSILLINNFSITPNEVREDVEVDFEIEDKSKLESYYLWEIVSLESDDDGEENPSSSQFSETWINDLTNNPIVLVNKDREFLGAGSFGDGTYQGSYNSQDGNKRMGNSSTDKVTANGVASSEELSEEILNLGILDSDKNLDIDISTTLTEELEGGGPTLDEEDSNKIVYKYELRVMTISKELYKYYSSLEEYYQKNGSNNSSESPFKFYSNVNNGAGIFAGFSESVIQF